MTADPLPDVVITADTHVGEPEALRERLPETFRARLPELTVNTDGNLVFKVNGKVVYGPPERKPTAEDLLREFRSDPSQGTNLERRLHDMAIEGVDGQVIFPNIGLCCSMGDEDVEYYQAWARAHNDLVWDLFSPYQHRFKPAGMIPVDDIDLAVAEAERCIERGFCTLFLPAVVPWQPYWMSVYEPLWSVAEEAGVPLNFHVFSGNLALRNDFASAGDLNQDRYEKARRAAKEADDGEELLDAVLGLAAGMSPIINLTGAGVLERHPNLRFVVTESECGWLAWLLQAMDQMQERRYIAMRKLSLRASEYFKRQGAVTISDDPVALNNVELTGSDCLIWGNDYPHDEGTFPHSRRPIEEIKKRFGPEDAHKVLCGNAARLFGFDLDYLAANRDEVRRHRHRM
jgi:predicted TIM-barrel fold metal-dependent hydrolase